MFSSQEFLDHLTYLRKVKFASSKGKLYLQTLLKKSSHPNLVFLAKLAYEVVSSKHRLRPGLQGFVNQRKFSKARNLFKKHIRSNRDLEDLIERPLLLQTLLIKIALLLPHLTVDVVFEQDGVGQSPKVAQRPNFEGTKSSSAIPSGDKRK